MAGERMLRIVGESLHPVAQLRDVNAEVLRRLRIGNAALLDQPNCLKLELTCELPTPLHGLPPAPLNTLTRCLRNRGQANHSLHVAGASLILLCLIYGHNQSHRRPSETKVSLDLACDPKEGNLRAVRFCEIYAGVLSRSLIVDQANSAAPSVIFR